MRQAEAEDAAIGQFFVTSGIEPFRVVYEEFTPIMKKLSSPFCVG